MPEQRPRFACFCCNVETCDETIPQFGTWDVENLITSTNQAAKNVIFDAIRLRFSARESVTHCLGIQGLSDSQIDLFYAAPAAP